MTRYSAFSLIAVIVLFLSVLPTAFAGPTCVDRHGKNNCVQACKHRWGQPSRAGTDPASHRHGSSASPPPQSSSKPSPSPHSTPKPPSKNSESTPAPSPSPNTSSNKLTSGSDIDQYLSAHNSIRAQHGATDLTWSDTLASAAQKWADGCAFKHSGGSLGPYGENLAAGTGSSYDIAAAIKSWTDEASQYDPGNPQPSHFTQVVWKATTQVGCAVQSCDGIFDSSFGKAKYYVCEYSSQGNVIGHFGENVQA